MVKAFIRAHGLPIQNMFQGSNHFKAVNYLHAVMVNSNLKYQDQDQDQLPPEFAAEWNTITTYRNKLLKDEIDAVSKNAGSVPIRRGRLAFVGRGRAGKSSTIRALRGETFDGAMTSTVGIEVADTAVNVNGNANANETFNEDGVGDGDANNNVNVRDVGADITHNYVSGAGEAWDQISKNVGQELFSVKMNLLKSSTATRTAVNGNDNEISSKFGEVGTHIVERVRERNSKIKDFASEISARSTRVPQMQMQTKGWEAEESQSGERQPINVATRDPNFFASASAFTHQESSEEAGTDNKNVMQQHYSKSLPFETENETDQNELLGMSTSAPTSPDDDTVDVDQMNKKMIIDNSSSQVRITIFDNGGQPIFRNVQHLYMPRNSCYVLVFNITDLLTAKTKEEAIEDMRFWIKSIRAHAVAKRVSVIEEDQDHADDYDRVKHSPIVLIGTHLDEIKKKKVRYRVTHILRKVNAILIREFGSMIRTPAHAVKNTNKGVRVSKSETNTLCYWPIDNTDENDPNIIKLRTLLVQEIIEDPLDYVNDGIPISWLKVMDELVKMSDDDPLLQLYSTNKHENSVVGVMHKCHALDDIIGDEEACIKRVIAFMQFGHRIGSFVYFDNIPGLEGSCILNPQWIVDTMTYIIRDVKLHRFRRDFKAMDVNNGESWTALVMKGILDLALLRRLWLGEEHCLDFLANLMVNLGLFGVLPLEKGKSDQRFVVPSMITVPFDVKQFSDTMILEHLGLDSMEGGCKKTIRFEDDFMPIGYSNRVIARLVTDWKRSYATRGDPTLLPNGCLLRMGTCPFALLLDVRGSAIVIMTYSRDASSIIIPHIMKVMTNINNDIYDGSLRFFREYPKIEKVKAVSVHPSVGKIGDSNEHSQIIAYRDAISAPLRNLDLRDIEIDAADDMRKINVEMFFSFFTKFGVSADKARIFGRTIVDGNPNLTPSDLKLFFDTTRLDAFRADILKDTLGLKCPIDQDLVIFALQKSPNPKEQIDYLLGYFCEDCNLRYVEKEKNIIRQMLAPANLKLKAAHDPGQIIKHITDDRSKVMHFAMHGHSETLQITTSGGTIVQPELLNNILGMYSRNDSGDTDASIECIFFNACCTYEFAKPLNRDQRVKWIVSWKTDVDDKAAMCFAESFYHYLGSSRDNSTDFKRAYDRACADLKLRGWAMICPLDKELLTETQGRQGNFKLRAAGIPYFHSPDSTDDALDVEHYGRRCCRCVVS